MVMNINTADIAEGLGLAIGLDLNMVMEIFSQTGANSASHRPTARTCATATTSAAFGAHAAKDSGIALALGQAEGLNRDGQL